MTYDFLIVGSGVAATALTERLLKIKPSASILILEAGDRVPTKDFALWQEFLINKKLPYVHCRDLAYPELPNRPDGENLTSGSTPVELAGSRLFVYGGSTMEWGGWSLRLKPEDFVLHSETGQGADWPFVYDALEKYYCQAESHLAVSGNSSDPTVPRSADYPFKHFPLTLQDKPVADAMEALNITFGSMPIARRGVSDVPSRHAPCQTTGTCDYCPFGARYVASNYLDDLRTWSDCPGLEVRLNAVVETINVNPSNKRHAVSVTYTDRTTDELKTEEAEQIIVAAGAIESAKLLQRSDKHWTRGIGNDSGHVGANFITHPMVIFNSPRMANPLRLQPELDFPTLISRHFDTKAEQRAGKFVIMNPKNHVQLDLVSKLRAGINRRDINTYLIKNPDSDPVKPGFSRQLLVYIEVFGEKTNTISNCPKRNHLGMLETIVNFSNQAMQSRVADIAKVISKIYTEIAAQLGMTTQVTAQDVTRFVGWGAHHASSTCRMSVHPGDGVVDKDLKIHGMENLYICSNAVFPSIGAVNPTLTLTALALRLGDHLNGNPVRRDV